MNSQVIRSLTPEEQQIYVQGWEAGYEFAKNKFTAEEDVDVSQLSFEGVYDE